MADFQAWSYQNETTNKTKFAVNLKFWKQGKMLMIEQNFKH